MTSPRRITTILFFVPFIVSGCQTFSVRSTHRETNIVFRFERNQPVIASASIDGHAGKFVLATAEPASILDQTFASRLRSRLFGRHRLLLGEHFRATIAPLTADLEGMADGLLGFDLLNKRLLSVDYQKQLISVEEPVDPPLGEMPVYEFGGVPAVPLLIDGDQFVGVVDTSLPDSLVLPLPMNPDGPAAGRGNASVVLGNLSLARVDVAYADTPVIRIGNRLLAEFLLLINYRDGWIGLWKYPRQNAASIH